MRTPSFVLGLGRVVDLWELPDEAITIENIAWALAQINRYNGQTPYPYSVAVHSVLVSELVPKHLALPALLHDATEAFVGDVSKWIKRDLPEFKLLEHTVEMRVAEVFGVDFSDPEIKAADELALFVEQYYLQNQHTALEYYDRIGRARSARVAHFISCEFDWEIAKLMFLERFQELT